MMKKYLVFLPLLLAFFVMACDNDEVSQKQADSFIKYYTNYPEFSAADVVVLNNSGYAILGTATTPNDGNQICLLRTDEFGNSVDSARLFGQKINNRVFDDRAFCLKKLEDDGFAILGSSKNPVSQKLEVYFVRTNSVGDTAWTRTLKVNGNVEARHFEVGDDGAFYITGYSDDYTTLGKEVWLFALNQDGSNRWPSARHHGGPMDDEGTHLQVLNNGYLAITGRTKSATSVGTNRSFILLTRENGILYAWYDIKSPDEEEGTCLREVSDDNYLVLNTVKTTLGTSISLKYIDINTPDTTIWTKTYGESDKDISRSLLVNGSTFYLLGTTSLTGTNTAISVISTDASGNQQESYQFGLGTELSGSAFEQTTDGGLIIVGTNKHSANDIALALIKTKPVNSR